MAERPTGVQTFKREEKMKYKFSDDVIAQIAKIVQLAMVTGTDIVDNLRTLELTAEDDKLFVCPEYKEVFEQNLDKMVKELNDAIEEKQKFDNVTKSGSGFFN